MYAHGGLVEAGHGADLARGAVAVMTEHEHGALAAVEAIDGGGEPLAPLAREQAGFRIRRHDTAKGQRCRGLASHRLVGRREPAFAAGSRLSPIQAAVDENSCEPDLERPGLAVGPNMSEDLDE